MKRVVLTGGSGFVGANLARRLIMDGHDVHLLLRPEHNPWRVTALSGNAVFHSVNLQDAAAVTSVVNSIRPDWVFHLAASGAYSWQRDLKEIFDTNLHSTINLLRAGLATGFEAFVHAGSSSEYGLKPFSPSERECLEPNSHYAVAKAAASLFCQHTAREENAPVTVLRLYSAYGPWEDPRRLIPMLVLCGLQGRLPPLASPDTARDYVYVDDVVEAFIAAAARAKPGTGEIYNIGTGVQTRLHEVVEMVRTEMGITAEPQWGSMPSRQWDTSVWVADRRKVTAELGWNPSVPFAGGIRNTIEWMQQEPGALCYYTTNSAG